MHIIVGSENPQKIQAVTDMVLQYEFLMGATVTGKAVSSDVSDQPMTLEETVRGATARAQAAQIGVDYGFGIESGLMEVPHTKTGFMNICVCVIFDGTETFIGISSAFELPESVLRLVQEKGMSVSEAAHAAELTANTNIGYGEGVVGLLTDGRVTRKSYAEEAIRMALIHLERKVENKV